VDPGFHTRVPLHSNVVPLKTPRNFCAAILAFVFV
jgi:hypothetical protein